MFHFIWFNKEWMFSGVGIPIVLFVGGLLYRIFDRRKAEPPILSLHSDAQDRFTRPTPAEIHRQIGLLTPFQQKSADGSYRGIRVRWAALFRDVTPQGKTWTVFLEHVDPRFPGYSGSVFCDGLEIESNPRLKIARENERLIVCGTIDRVDRCVHLKNVSLEFV
jgi:hypothetical protein